MLSYVSSISSVLASLYLGAHLGAHDALEANLLVAARVSEQLANANTSHLMSGQTYASAAAAGRRGTTRGPPAERRLNLH